MPLSIGVLSTYPPTQCGLATYSAALVRALADGDDRVSVVSVVDDLSIDSPDEVIEHWVRGSAASLYAAAAALNRQDLVILEHEFGIFGGREGEDILDLVARIKVPLVTMMHTVLTHPTARQRRIIESLLRASGRVAVMTRAGRQRLIAVYGADPTSVIVIPHGAHASGAFTKVTSMFRHRPTVVTWGLLGKGKGLEWAIEGMHLLRGLDPSPMYRILGRTHPTVARHEGEGYRQHLARLVDQWRLHDDVVFDSRYFATNELFQTIAQADVVLLPYDSEEQVTSGVLVEAVALGKPVISTPFPHAVELLSSGAGMLIPRRDPKAIAEAIQRILGDPSLARRMAAEARRLAPSLQWSSVAEQHRELAMELSSASMRVERVESAS